MEQVKEKALALVDHWLNEAREQVYLEKPKVAKKALKEANTRVYFAFQIGVIDKDCYLEKSQEITAIQITINRVKKYSEVFKE